MPNALTPLSMTSPTCKATRASAEDATGGSGGAEAAGLHDFKLVQRVSLHSERSGGAFLGVVRMCVRVRWLVVGLLHEQEAELLEHLLLESHGATRNRRQRGKVAQAVKEGVS